MLPLLLKPAVSIKLIFLFSKTISVSIESLVVPAIGLTIDLSSPIIELNKEDFPTFGFPTIATFIESDFSGKIV